MRPNGSNLTLWIGLAVMGGVSIINFFLGLHLLYTVNNLPDPQIAQNVLPVPGNPRIALITELFITINEAELSLDQHKFLINYIVINQVHGLPTIEELNALITEVQRAGN